MRDTLTMNATRLSARPLVLKAEDLRAAIEAAWGQSKGWFLGHGMDGVIWGRLLGGKLEVAADAGHHGAALSATTLLDARLFDGLRELRVWRVGSELECCDIREGGESGPMYSAHHDLSYCLVGSRLGPGKSVGGFAERRGSAGETHSPPVVDTEPARFLKMRHYYAEDAATGLLRVAEHRALDLS